MKLPIYVLLVSGLAFAQSFQGSLRGRVKDPHGAAATTSKITIVDEATSVARATVTNDQGEYAFTAVTPATYTVKAARRCRSPAPCQFRAEGRPLLHRAVGSAQSRRDCICLRRRYLDRAALGRRGTPSGGASGQ